MTPKQTVRVRIAPSPTGTLHVGTARAALYNYLFAKQNNGIFIVRSEDTDAERSTRAFEDSILADLDWLGLTWDEGSDRGGAYGPYRQSERTDLYQEHLEKLQEAGMTYRCTCTPERLASLRASQQQNKQPPRYDGHCREKAEATSTDRWVVRLRMPKGKSLSFTDHVRGTVSFVSDELDDFVIAVDNGARVLYNFAVVVDDALMRISHVIRGEDHLSNTPKQMLIAEALQIPIPEYAHLPLLLDTKRAKLSKRAGAVAVHEYREQGIVPEALVNYLALMGWNPKTTEEILSMEQLIQAFSLDTVHRGGAVFDQSRLLWMNGKYLRSLDLARLEGYAQPFLPLRAKTAGKEYVREVLSVARTRLETLSELPAVTDFFFTDTLSVSGELLVWKDQSPKDAAHALKEALDVFASLTDEQYKPKGIESALRANAKEQKRSVGSLLWPVRVALTGKKKSISPFEVAAVLGRQKTQERLETARILLEK